MIDWKRGILPSIGYKTNKWLFLIPFFIMLITIIIGAITYGLGTHYYYYCPTNSKFDCLNPMRTSCSTPLGTVNGMCFTKKIREEYCTTHQDFCNQELISPGMSIGEKPDTFYNALPYIAFLPLLIGAILNHLLYNRKFFKDKNIKFEDV